MPCPEPTPSLLTCYLTGVTATTWPCGQGGARGAQRGLGQGLPSWGGKGQWLCEHQQSGARAVNSHPGAIAYPLPTCRSCRNSQPVGRAAACGHAPHSGSSSRHGATGRVRLGLGGVGVLCRAPEPTPLAEKTGRWVSVRSLWWSSPQGLNVTAHLEKHPRCPGHFIHRGITRSGHLPLVLRRVQRSYLPLPHGSH